MTKAILVTGSRDFKDRTLVQDELWACLAGGGETRLVVGDCPTGADEFAVSFWRRRILPGLGDGLIVFKADWDTHGKSAGPLRNAEMVRHVVDNHAMDDIVVLAFFQMGAANRGTRNCVAAALAAGIPDGQIRRFWA